MFRKLRLALIFRTVSASFCSATWGSLLQSLQGESESCATGSVAPSRDGPGRRAPACDGIDRAKLDEAELGERVEQADARVLKRSADISEGLVLLRFASSFFNVKVADRGMIQVIGRRFRLTDCVVLLSAPSTCIAFEETPIWGVVE